MKILPFLFGFALLPLVPASAQPVSGQSVPAPATQPAPTANPKIDPAASALLDRSAQAYAAISNFSMDFKTFVREDGKLVSGNGQFVFSRPGQAKVTFKTGSLSKQIAIVGDKIYSTKDEKNYQTTHLLDDDPIEAIAQNVPTGLTIPLTFLVAGENPLTADSIFEWQQAALLPDDGVAATARIGENGPVFKFRLFFGHNDLLLRRVETEVNIRGEKSLDWATVSTIRTNPVFAPDALRFVPVAGSREEAVPPRYDPALKAGATPFALTGVDLSKYRGKVVLLDFWATWCAPCIAELPNIQRVYDKYHDQGFEVIGISLDEEQDALQNFVNDRKILWPQLFDGRGFQNANAKRYSLSVIPFSLLIDAEGKIVVANPHGKQLESSVQKLLNP